MPVGLDAAVVGRGEAPGGSPEKLGIVTIVLVAVPNGAVEVRPSLPIIMTPEGDKETVVPSIMAEVPPIDIVVPAITMPAPVIGCAMVYVCPPRITVAALAGGTSVVAVAMNETVEAWPSFLLDNAFVDHVKLEETPFNVV